MRAWRIRSPRYGWQEVYRAWSDPDLYFLVDRDGQHSLAAVPTGHEWRNLAAARDALGWRKAVQLLAGPSATLEPVMEAAVRWLLDHPTGHVAELIARPPYNPLIRELIEAAAWGDSTARKALHDVAAEMGFEPNLADHAAYDLIDKGIWTSDRWTDRGIATVLTTHPQQGKP
jgi:hypothetical protein